MYLCFVFLLVCSLFLMYFVYDIINKLCSTRHGRSSKEKTKCLASSVQKLWKKSQNLKSRSRDAGHAPIGGVARVR